MKYFAVRLTFKTFLFVSSPRSLQVVLCNNKNFDVFNKSKKNEWILLDMKGKMWLENREYPANIINWLKSVIVYMFQLAVSYN